MRRPLAATALFAVAMIAAACSSSQAPNWTYAPPTPAPSAGPSGSAGASAGASSAASTAPSPEASGAAPSAQASGGSGGTAAGGTVLDITAQGVQWTTTDLTAPANTAFKIHFDNQDASTPHNIQIKDASGMDLFKSDLLTGVAQADYEVPALAPGKYTFVCQVHPNMVGNLTVGP